MQQKHKLYKNYTNVQTENNPSIYIHPIQYTSCTPLSYTNSILVGIMYMWINEMPLLIKQSNRIHDGTPMNKASYVANVELRPIHIHTNGSLKLH